MGVEREGVSGGLCFAASGRAGLVRKRLNGLGELGLEAFRALLGCSVSPFGFRRLLLFYLATYCLSFSLGVMEFFGFSDCLIPSLPSPVSLLPWSRLR